MNFGTLIADPHRDLRHNLDRVWVKTLHRCVLVAWKRTGIKPWRRSNPVFLSGSVSFGIIVRDVANASNSKIAAP